MEKKDEEIQKAWREGFEAGVKTFERQNNREIKIGKAILEVLFETFETRKEDY